MEKLFVKLGLGILLDWAIIRLLCWRRIGSFCSSVFRHFGRSMEIFWCSFGGGSFWVLVFWMVWIIFWFLWRLETWFWNHRGVFRRVQQCSFYMFALFWLGLNLTTKTRASLVKSIIPLLQLSSISTDSHSPYWLSDPYSSLTRTPSYCFCWCISHIFPYGGSFCVDF